MNESNVISIANWRSSGNVESAHSNGKQTAPDYGAAEWHPELRSITKAIYDLRQEEPDISIADSTIMYAIKAALNLPHDVPTPNIECDDDGVIEFEWEESGWSFSIYITDTSQTAFAGYFGRDDNLSGTQDVSELFEGDDVHQIRKVFGARKRTWSMQTG